ncbi:MAG: restriction endonuclease subunit S [Prevotellaceae bacterium]|jgi:restriction endonuclease S subunit|nr:restriction endonuclease subunit S [Prevotellaceae bacterium]
MANKITTAKSIEIEEVNRFESRYFYNRNLLTDTFNKFGFSTINAIADLKSGSTPEHYDEKHSEKDCYFIKSADVKRYNLNETTISYVSEQTHKTRKRMLVFPDDILVSNTGKYLGFACVVPEEIAESTTNQNISILKLNKKGHNFNSYFIATYLNSYFGQREIESLLTLTGQKYLNSTNFKRLRIPIIDNEMVKKISDKMQTAILKETKSLSLLQQAQTLFYEKLDIDFSKVEKQNYFSVKLSDFASADLWSPMYSYPLYVNTLKEVQKKIQTISLGKIATLKKGDEVGSDNYIGYLEKRKTDVPFVRTSDIVNYETDQYPDFYIPKEIFNELQQNNTGSDILFTKDGKIGMVGMITENEKSIIASGLARIKLKTEAKQYNVTPEYLFLVLSLKEFGSYASKRRTVVASTIPHLREERLREIEIPIIEKSYIDELTILVREAFELKDERKQIINEVRNIMDNYFE